MKTRGYNPRTARSTAGAVVRYWARVAARLVASTRFRKPTRRDRNEQAAVRDRRRDVCGRDRFRLRGVECRRARQEDGKDGEEGCQGREKSQGEDREEDRKSVV